MTDEQDEMVRRIHHICQYVRTPGAAVVHHDPTQWAMRTDLTDLEEQVGFLGLVIDHTQDLVELHLCPALLAQVTVTLPWSPEPDCDELVLDEDAIADPEDQTVIIPVDIGTRSDERCHLMADGELVCDKVHAGLPVAVHYEACDDPDPDGYWFFDNLVRGLAMIAQAELLSFVDDQMTGQTSTPSRRRHQAWERLYLMHPAVHRFMATALVTGLDLAQQDAA